MGNKGAFVTLTGGELKPNYTTYEAVVSSICVTMSKATLVIRKFSTCSSFHKIKLLSKTDLYFPGPCPCSEF